VRTTLDINDATLKALKALALSSGRPFKEVVEESLKLGLGIMSKPRQTQPFRVKSHDLQLKPGFHGTSLNQLYDQIEGEKDAGS